ncbi:MAG: hypothetical protein HQL94_04875 [Magnetococcales bacterium]|nr:hypothetical protein [Magnetococcales bacterium]MBF0437742.1 hypothetical protein [Magnetococcales bacterium]
MKKSLLAFALMLGLVAGAGSAVAADVDGLATPLKSGTFMMASADQDLTSAVDEGRTIDKKKKKKAKHGKKHKKKKGASESGVGAGGAGPLDMGAPQ